MRRSHLFSVFYLVHIFRFRPALALGWLAFALGATFVPASGADAGLSPAPAPGRETMVASRQNSALQAAEMRVQKAELGRQAAELAEARAWRWALAAGFTAALAVLCVAVFMRYARRRAELRLLAEIRAARVTTERAEALRSRLLAVASNELKAPLRNMIRLSEFLAGTAPDPVVTRETAAALRQTGVRLFALVHDLIDVAALEKKSFQLKREPVRLSNLVTEVVAAHRELAREKSQTLTLEIAAEPPLVSADPARLYQALANLINNAIKFTSSGHAVRVCLQASEQTASIEVADEGPGLTPEDLVQAFQPFRTLSARPTGRESSSGLGLSLAQQIVVLHGGQLLISSVPGAGSVFTIVLPLEVAPPLAQELQPS